MRQLQKKNDHGPGGFTLVELMVSIAMVMLLMAGIYAVFDAASRTTGTGAAVQQFTEAARSMERLMSDDFQHAAPARHMPCIVIYSEQAFTFADQMDMNGDADGKPETADLNRTGKELPLRPAVYNTRSHRIDRLVFFDINDEKPFIRQTGRPGASGYAPELLSQGSSREAMLWYGHLALPGSAPGTFFGPEVRDLAKNPNNFFANDWCLGRTAMLLDPTIDMRGTPGQLGYIPPDNTGKFLLTPLSGDSCIPGGPYIFESFIDVARTNVGDFRDGDRNTNRLGTKDVATGAMRDAFDYRFRCKTQISRGSNIPAMAQEMAQTVPFLRRGVTQFIVEFAGDFVTQADLDASVPGRITAPVPDGETDFVAIAGAGQQFTKQIRWYGMPRNVNTSDDGVSQLIRGKPNNRTVPNDLLDVVPVRDVYYGAWQSFFPNNSPQLQELMDMEFFVNDKVGDIKPQSIADYAGLNGMPPGARYVCVFTPQMLASGRGPKLIRITMTINDPNGRLPEGQTVQYVFSLPQ